MIRFIEVVNQTNFNPRMERTAKPKFTLGEVWINEDYVVSVREALGYKALLREGLLPTDLEEDHKFTTIVTNNGSQTQQHVVVGSPTVVATRLSSTEPTLLKG
tara:strand:- start:1257 stop:1565 length:309 start_codon:yes stop_codon:yes gene_type:complete